MTAFTARGTFTLLWAVVDVLGVIVRVVIPAMELGNLVLDGRYAGSAMSSGVTGGVRVGLWMGGLCWSR